MLEDKKEKLPRVLIFGGTTESRVILDFLRRFNVKVILSVATEYGKECVEPDELTEVSCRRMDGEEILTFMKEKAAELVIDATHPFATEISRHIGWACEKAAVECLRCLREETGKTESEKQGAVVYVESIKGAVEYLSSMEGGILITTGSKDLKEFCRIPDYRTRCVARVLSVPGSVESSAGCGFSGRNLIAMQAPFSKEMNIATIHYSNASFLVTKESGDIGGMKEKMQACSETGTTLVIVRRPEETGRTVKEICDDLDMRYRKYRK